LIEVKRKFGASPQDDLHCSRMFGPTARSKSAWAHLSNEEIFDLYTTLFTKLNQLPIYKVAVSSKKTDWPKEIEGAPWKHKNPDFVGPHPWQEGFNLGEKHIAAFLRKNWSYGNCQGYGFENSAIMDRSRQDANFSSWSK
jgi:hypothetical protein